MGSEKSRGKKKIHSCFPSLLIFARIKQVYTRYGYSIIKRKEWEWGKKLYNQEEIEKTNSIRDN